jgi:hypothetical protein
MFKFALLNVLHTDVLVQIWLILKDFLTGCEGTLETFHFHSNRHPSEQKCANVNHMS